MSKVRVHTISLGCPKNRVDTERLLGALGRNFAPADSVAASDLVLINTCGFIRPAVEESIETILAAIREAAEADPRPVLAVAGCLVSRYGQADLAADLPEVNLWLSTRELETWPALVGAALGRKNLEALGPRRLSTGPAYAYLKVSEGCSHKCAFCTIPSIRGRHVVSRPLDELEREARLLVEQGGVSELVIVGQDVTSYGRDLGLKDGLKHLLDRLLPIKGLRWLRLMYLYPAGLTDGLLKHMASLTGPGLPLLPYFDIPLQHAHPDILAAMGRPFARDPSLVIDRVRKHFPDAALRTSLIVGYPGETDAHFKALKAFVQRTRFAHLGVFPYHQEEGTPAASLPGQVPQGIKTRRKNALMKLQEGISREHLSGLVGQRLEVLVEEPSPEWPGLHVGRVWFQAPEVDGVTYVSGPKVRPGKIVLADIEQAQSYDLVALA